MSLPNKAVRYSWFKSPSQKEDIPASGHPVSFVAFEEQSGRLVQGFFKPLADDYPPLLAKYSVAVSVLIRLALGPRAAEERLVFDESEHIVGTFSEKLPEYKPLAARSDKLPSNPQERDLVSPPVATLLKCNVIELLVAAYCHKCDDRHPGNVSVQALIDYDMFLYFITWIIKGPRFIDGVLQKIPEQLLHLKKIDLDNFPHIDGRTHWPTYAIPGNYFITKQYKAYQAFQDLAKNPTLQLANQENVSAQEQFFTALLKELLVFDPNVLRAGLTEALGVLPLDYLSLGDEKSMQLEQHHGSFFKPELNSQCFIEHIMQVFQKEYDELYRTVVFYSGCPKNKFGVSVPGFYQFLQNHPSAVKQVLKWAERASQTVVQFDLDVMKRRYHAIWRDSQLLLVKHRIASTQQVIEQISCQKTSVFSLGDEQPDFDDGLEWEVICKFGDKVILGDPDNEPWQLMQQLLEKLSTHSQHYFTQPMQELMPNENRSYYEELVKLVGSYEPRILDALDRSSIDEQAAAELAMQIQLIKAFCNNLNFQVHLHSKDAVLECEESFNTYSLSATDESVVNQCLTTLFEWANKMDAQDNPSISQHTILEGCIQVALERYKPVFNPLPFRTRYSSIEEDLAKRTIRGANFLAKILSEGGIEATSFNIVLLQEILPRMLDDVDVKSATNLLIVRDEIGNKKFDWTFYAQEARKIACKDESFVHVNMEQAPQRFNRILFQCAEQCEPHKFRALIYDALKEYESSLFMFFRKRGSEVREWLNRRPPFTNAELLVCIFGKGEIQTTSFNRMLFNKILPVIQNMVAQSNKADDQFILQITVPYVERFLASFVQEVRKTQANNLNDSAQGSFSITQV